MATFARPGIFVQEVPVSQAVQFVDNGSACGAFIGALSTGPVGAPVLVRSWSQFVQTFGDINDAYNTSWAVYNFFSNGGNQAYVCRIVGSGSATSSVVLTDSSQSALSTLLVKAINAGSWGNTLSVQVINSGAAGRFGLYVYQTVGSSSVLVEQFVDLSMNSTDPRYAPSYINSQSGTIYVVDQHSASVSPNNNPAADGTQHALTGGLDGSTPARADYQAVYTAFDPIQNPLVFNVPQAAYTYSSGGSGTDRTTSLYLTGDVVKYAATRTDAFVVADFPSGLTVSDAKTYASDLKSQYAAATAGGIVAMYYPWIAIPDPGKASRSATRLQAPGASAIGQFLATDSRRGVFKAPAGYTNRISLAVSVQSALANTDLDTLNTGTEPVNAIRQIPGSGMVIMGARTMDNTTGNRYINVRRSIMYLKTELEQRSNFALFENNDAILWSRLRTSLSTFLRGYWQQGGLRGTSPSEAFYVICDGSNNSDADIQNGLVNITIGVAIEYPAEFIVIQLGQITGNAQA